MEKVKNFLAPSLIFLALFSAESLFAQGDNPEPQGGITNPEPQGGITNPSSEKLNNPLNNVDDIPTLVETFMDIVLTVAVPLIVIALIYAGFKFVAAQGNSEKLKSAKQTLIYIVVGAAILLGAYAIAQGIFATVTAITG
ncbi:hypothetical protein CL684_00880 [Candidatus Campbellbacteria bacterium]|nr:hypothetical protein [Candidatus Campbellbacteria bacterium]|tara:strand:- start:1165 stop:1584 length:420 start_codon:yes stop_codon:yes gene_type:complete